MKLFLDFFPIVLFFVAFKLANIYVATGVAIAATVAQIAWLRYSTGKVEPMQWLSLAIIVLFGGATILAHDDTFIKWKPTVLYWMMGGALAGGMLFFRKNFLKSLMGAQLELPEPAWRAMSWSWATFFACMGVLNLWVAFHYDTNTWVNFKLFGGLGLMLLFVLGQALYLGRYMKDGKKAEASDS
ncbi:septation protein A [Ramlibacter ginsenosidimutans]|uniref:Inner membrane-spanning protein YciB n=1 Tax=Ramlibacter ginsenosidimutans TaxID=502333 RepID=A0A934TUH0_9BURK|nr:septation protein A [Ramlibacter ginsenosidimutans]MBK6007812.1 septation protein A [Ramlibacter ginsenosidimutans]